MRWPGNKALGVGCQGGEKCGDSRADGQETETMGAALWQNVGAVWDCRGPE